MNNNQKFLNILSITLYVSLVIPTITFITLAFIDIVSPARDPGKNFALGIAVGLLLTPVLFVLFFSSILSFIMGIIFSRKNGFSQLNKINQIAFYISSVLTVLLIIGGTLAYISYLNTPKY